MRAPPLAVAAAAMLVGSAAALAGVGPASAGVVVVSACLGAALLLRGSGRYAVVALGFIAVGHAAATAGALRHTHDCRQRLPDGARIRLRGTLVAEPPQDGAAHLLVEAAGTGALRRCMAVARARLGKGGGAVAGAELTGTGRWLAPLHTRTVRPSRPSGMVLLDRVRVVAPASAGHHPLLAVRGSLQRRIRRLYPARAPLVDALLLARKEGLDPATRERFARAGLSHLLAISGFHVGLVAGAVLLLVRALGAAHGVATLTVIGVVAAYVAFLGAPYAALRAALQIALFAGARLLQRPSRPMALLAAAALLLFLLDPLVVGDVGFQLSFAGVAGILLLRRRLLGRLAGVPRPLAELLAAGVAAFAGTAPFVAYHFGRIAPVGIAANLVAVPVLALAVPTLVLSLAADMVSAGAGEFVAGAGKLLLAVLDAVGRAAAVTPFGQLYVTRSAALACGAAGALLLGAWHRRRRSVRAVVRGAAVAGLVTAGAMAWPVAALLSPEPVIEVHAIDVGQGDALAIRSPRGRWVVVDAGPRTERFDAGRARVVPYLLAHGTRRIELLILTHPDADHIGGARAVLTALDVGAVLEPGATAGKPGYLSLLEAAQNVPRWVAARAGRRVELDGMVLDVLFPPPGALDATEGANDLSVVFRLVYGRFAALFLGDAPSEVEERLVEAHGPGLGATLLKVGHHGSATSTSVALLSAAHPSVALIPVGRHNRFGHPHEVVLGRLRDRGIRMLRTDRDGSIRIRARLDGRYRIETSRGSVPVPTGAPMETTENGSTRR